MIKASKNRGSERGSASTKLLMVLVVLGLLANAGINYVPVAYEAESFKQEMQTVIIQSMAVRSNGTSPVNITKNRLSRAAQANNIPSDAFMDVRQINNVLQARVYYAKPVTILPLGIYTYNYEFDHTATPTGFLAKDIQ